MAEQESTNITIEATKRDKSGKSYTRKLRRTGKIPANLLNKGKSTPIELDPKLLSKAWKADKTLDLTLEGATQRVIITELQIDRVKRTAMHVDLKVT